jgi:hypothetical protein
MAKIVKILQLRKILFCINNCNLFIPRPQWRTPKLQEKPFSLKKEHPKHEICSLFVGLWCLASGSGSAFVMRIRILPININADPCRSGSTALIHCGFKEQIFKPNYTKNFNKEKILFLTVLLLYRVPMLPYYQYVICQQNKTKVRPEPKTVWSPNSETVKASCTWKPGQKVILPPGTSLHTATQLNTALLPLTFPEHTTTLTFLLQVGKL